MKHSTRSKLPGSEAFAAALTLSILLSPLVGKHEARAFFPTRCLCIDDLLPRQPQVNKALNDREFMFGRLPDALKEQGTKWKSFARCSGLTESAEARRKLKPDEIYAKAWSAAEHSFADRTFNGQDWKIWKKKYKGRLLDEEDATRAIETMLASLGDRHSFFRSQRESSEIGGVGLKIAMKSNHTIVVVESIEQSPASKAGVQRDWEIIHVDGKSTRKSTLDQVAAQIRGTTGTPVVLGFADKSGEQVMTIKREKITMPTVMRSCVMNSNVGYIRLSSLRETTSTEMERTIAKLSSTKGLILDLRDCDGRCLYSAMNVADLFLPKGKCIAVVRLIENRRTIERAFMSTNRLLYPQPVAVLTNGGTSGTPELIVAALRDNGATTYGQLTDGNATILREVSLGSGQLMYITTGIAITPNRKEHFYWRGLKPDVPITPILYYSGCTGDQAFLPNGPWYLFSSNLGLNTKIIGALGAEDLERSELSYDTRELLNDCQLATAYQALKRL